MPTFVHALELITEPGRSVGVTNRLNALLASLQKQGAKILDVKVSASTYRGGILRTFLITYEADEPLK